MTAPMSDSKGAAIRDKIQDLMVCDSHGYMCDDCPLEKNVDAILAILAQEVKKTRKQTLKEALTVVEEKNDVQILNWFDEQLERLG